MITATEKIMSKELTKKEETIMQIPQSVKEALIKELCDIEFIDYVNEFDDYDDYGSGSYEQEFEDGFCLDEPYDEWECSYYFVVSWKYHAWTEYLTDPDCSQSFAEVYDIERELDYLEIFTPDGQKVSESVVNDIIKIVNEKIKH